MSGLLVRMGLNGPRISAGASGFMSQVSIWLGAPRLKIMMQDFSSFPLATAPMDLSAANFGHGKPDGTQRAHLEKVTPRDAVAGRNGTVPRYFKHNNARWLDAFFSGKIQRIIRRNAIGCK